MIRKFYLKNSKGQTQTLTDKATRIFLNAPTGLGYANTLNTLTRPDYLSLTSTDLNFGTVSGEVIFYQSENSDRYEAYNDFVSFLSFTPLELYYSIPTSPAQVFHCDVEVLNLDKGESGTDNFMRCALSLQMLSRWKGEEVTLTGSSLTYTITNDGHIPVGFEITIEGSLTNPYFTLEQDGEMYGEAKFTDSTAFSSVYVNSNDGDQNVVLEQGGAIIANPLSYQDLSISNGAIYVTFVKLARGESTLTIGMDSGSVSSVNISFEPIYRSV